MNKEEKRAEIRKLKWELLGDELELISHINPKNPFQSLLYFVERSFRLILSFFLPSVHFLKFNVYGSQYLDYFTHARSQMMSQLFDRLDAPSR